MTMPHLTLEGESKVKSVSVMISNSHFIITVEYMDNHGITMVPIGPSRRDARASLPRY